MFYPLMKNRVSLTSEPANETTAAGTAQNLLIGTSISDGRALHTTSSAPAGTKTLISRFSFQVVRAEVVELITKYVYQSEKIEKN